MAAFDSARRVSGLLTAFVAIAAAQAPPIKPTGRLIDVSGHKFHLVCMGTGGPAVILVSGTGEFSFDWSLAQASMAGATRVCAYDRAGYAWSDQSPTFEQMPAVANDMRELLRKAGVEPPYVLVGHAFGALYARDYQRRFPGDVAGLLLVDPTPELDFQVQMLGNTVSLIDMADHDLKAWPVRPFAPSLTSPPPSRPKGVKVPEAPFDKLPREFHAMRTWSLERFFKELDALTADQALAVMESQRATFIEMYNNRHNPATSPLKVPVIVLSRGRDTTPGTSAMQDDLARLSGDAIHRTVKDSGTQIQIEKVETVTSAVGEIVRAIRDGKPLTPRP